MQDEEEEARKRIECGNLDQNIAELRGKIVYIESPYE